MSNDQSAAPELDPGRAGGPLPDDEAERRIRRISRRSFLWGAAAVAAGYGGWRWFTSREENNGVAWPLRRALRTNETVARALFSDGRLAPTFDRTAAAKVPRVNGDLGLPEDFDPAAWKLRVVGLADTASAIADSEGGELAVPITLAALKALPHTDFVTELNCIEGWTEIIHWGGVRFADFMAKYPPAKTNGSLPAYVSLETPDGGYYVGLEMASAMHPQTLLCYEINDQPLTLEHGAPLRLAIPVKYGVKNLKRIGTIRFTDKRPADYWAEQGYDWYAGF